MIDRPGEGLVGVPIPAILVGIGPTADGVGAPARRDVLWQPDIAIARMPDPLPVRIELVIEGIDVDGFLRRRGTSEAKPVGSRQRQARGCKERSPHERGRKQSQPITRRHFTLQVPAPAQGTRKSSLSMAVVCAVCGQTLAVPYENQDERGLTEAWTSAFSALSACLRGWPAYVDVYPPNLSGFRRQNARASGKGAIPTGRFLLRSRPNGRIAQVVEQLTLNQRVVGSSPTAPTKFVRTEVGLEPANAIVPLLLPKGNPSRLWMQQGE